MAGSVNKVILVGNVGQDPEVRQFQNGGQVCSFSIATSENWKDKNTGERREKTEWHRISVFNEGLIRVVQSYVKKGSKLKLSAVINPSSASEGALEALQVLLFIPQHGKNISVWLLSLHNKNLDLSGASYLKMHNPDFLVL